MEWALDLSLKRSTSGVAFTVSLLVKDCQNPRDPLQPASKVSDEKYVKGLTKYKPPAAEKKAEEGVPRAEEKAPEEKKTEDSGTAAQEEGEKKSEDVASQEKEDEKKKDLDPEDKTTKVEAEDPETEVPKPTESKPVEVSTEPSVKESGATVTPTEVPVPRAPIDPMPPPAVETPAETPSASETPAEVSAGASTISGVHEGGEVPGSGIATTGQTVPDPNLEVCQGCYGTGMAEVEMNRAIRILRTAHLVQVKEENMNDPVTDHEGPAPRLDSTISQDVSYVKGSHTHIVVELCCSGDSETSK